MKHFEPEIWLPKEERPAAEKTSTARNFVPADTSSVEMAVQALELTTTDITEKYEDWVQIGFAFAHEFGEGGRTLFHRVSRLSQKYEPRDCDLQYTRCLKSRRKDQEIRIGTFFYLVKRAGVDPVFWLGDNYKKETSSPGSGKEPQEVGDWTDGLRQVPPSGWEGPRQVQADTARDYKAMNEPGEDEFPLKDEVASPNFPESVYEELPEFLKKVVAKGDSPAEKDILLLGALGSLSACLPQFYGIYDGKRVFPNFYLFVTAPPSAGKGRLGLCRNLVMPIHKALRAETKQARLTYEQELAEFNATKGEGREKPLAPPEKMLFIPANSSSTGVLQLLSDNNCQGLIFESEGDTITNSFATSYSDFSDSFRNAFQHEPISYFRRTDKEYVSLDLPKLSTVLSGTPKQVGKLIPSAENGLFSRFLFYYMNLEPVWKDVWGDEDAEDLEEYFLRLGEEFFKFHKQLSPEVEIKVVFSKKQREFFNTYFRSLQFKYLHLQPREYTATIRRLALMFFRLGMVLTALRYMEDGNFSKVRQVEDRDFELVYAMAQVLVVHSSSVFYRLPYVRDKKPRSDRKERFLEALPAKFRWEDYQKVGLDLHIPSRTADRYIQRFVEQGLVHRDKPGEYEKIS